MEHDVAPDSQTGERRAPMFSVCVAAYNVEDYIQENIESVLAQTFRDWELVIVDDGSTDSAGAVVARYSHKYDNIELVTQANHGIGAARNHALEIARGSWVVALDADDRLAPGMLGIMADAIASNPDFSAFATSMDIFASDTGEIVERWGRPYNEAANSREITNLEVYRHSPNHGGATIRRCALQAIGGYSSERGGH